MIVGAGLAGLRHARAGSLDNGQLRPLILPVSLGAVAETIGYVGLGEGSTGHVDADAFPGAPSVRPSASVWPHR